MSELVVSISGRSGSFPLSADFTASRGVTALFGHSGAGKTTLLKMIAGTLSPEKGRIAIGDTVLFDSESRINAAPEKRHIGYVFQDARLFPHLSVRHNLTYALWAGRRQAGRPFAEVVDLLGLGSLLERRPATLSGGERQRVAIGRALLSNPALLLLDEPLSSLDHARRQEILPYLERLRDESGLPIVYVSHEIDEVARLADTLVVLSEGRVVASGPVAEVFSRIDGIGGAGEDAGALIEGHVTGWDPGYRVAFIDLGGEAFQVVDEKLRPGMHVRLRVRARDVSLARHAPEAISIRNVLPVRIVAISESGAFAEMELSFAAQVLRARLTRKSVADLGLKPGEEVFALVKAVSVDRSSMRFAKGG
ncbi:molybdenum ABC transporter ATP-binding protein [Phyllobacterium salinisoli]|uniref:Molybdenum ABC transporter ATP-binding protein n=1 Tax=Phyllobacterium salinisoli TaxID=1899321 RepID=A0A368K3G7_9HYPH|nr:molybdenum ABC transporter ATP-binding protein [Phyllobacterium salinisoli]RCS23936.1 molybdenum ABC transporter ATP-binding protein [Phyllobacterium salinisoli]